MATKKLNVSKFKRGDPVVIYFHDIHSNSNGWKDVKESLDTLPCECTSTGTYIGVSKYKEIVLGALASDIGNEEELAYGVRLYVPIGCIVSIKKLK